MSLQGVQPPPPQIPEDLRIAVENVQNRYTILEAEVIRLTKLKKSEEAAVGALITEKNREQEIVDKLASDIQKLGMDRKAALEAAEKAENDLGVIVGQKDIAQTQLNEVLGNIETARKDLGSLRAEITQAKEDEKKQKEKNQAAYEKMKAFIDGVVTLHNQLP